ncbi:aminopeptidase N, partial [Oceanospirillum sp. HFRX-1_2]
MSSDNNDVIYLKDYLPPAFLVQSADLVFDLYPHETRVQSRITFNRNCERDAGLPLELHGSELKLISVAIDGAVLNADQYQITGEQLIIPNVPDQFVLET